MFSPSYSDNAKNGWTDRDSVRGRRGLTIVNPRNHPSIKWWSGSNESVRSREKCSTTSPGNPFISGRKVKGQGRESQTHCRRGSLHSCEYWLFLVSVALAMYSVFFNFIFPYYLVSGLCARLSWPSRQLLSARLSTVSYRIVSYVELCVMYSCWWCSWCFCQSPMELSQSRRTLERWRVGACSTHRQQQRLSRSSSWCPLIKRPLCTTGFITQTQGLK